MPERPDNPGSTQATPAWPLQALVVACALAWAWLATRLYTGVAHDGVYYAMLALAERAPAALGHDIFVSEGSQGSFTIFPRVYAAAIAALGLERATLLLTLASNALALGAAWLLAGRLAPGALRLPAVLLLILIPGLYGADSIFGYLEPFATPRTAAEAAVLAATAAAVTSGPGLPRAAAASACLIAGLLLHPIMTLPGVLLCLLLAAPQTPSARQWAALATASALGASAVLATLGRMDADWLGIVHGVAPYLFLSEWSLGDWQRTAVPAAALLIASRVLPRDSVARRAGIAALALGALGLATALIATEAFPVALAVQGQPWRWMWLTKVIAVLLLAPTIGALWQLRGPASAAAVLLVAAWLGSEDALGLPAALLATLIVVLQRGAAPGGRAATLAAWAVTLPLMAAILRISSLLDEAGLAAIMAGCAWLITRRHAPAHLLAGLIVATGLGREAAAAIGTQHPQAVDFSEASISSFEPWRRRIPESSTVLHPGHVPMTWLLLQRASYIGPDQTIGATFSRTAALEMRRRARSIEALMPGDAMLVRSESPQPVHDLTIERRARLCALPGVDFVVGTLPLPGPRMAHPGLLPEPTLYLYRCSDLPREPEAAK